MIKIDYLKKLNKAGLNKASFEKDLVTEILNEKHIIVSVSNKNYINNFDIEPINNNLAAYVSKKIKFKTIFYLQYKYNKKFKGFVHFISKKLLNKKYENYRDFIISIILLSPENLEKKFCGYKFKSNTFLIVIKLFNYTKNRDILVKSIKKFDFRVCIYCNRTYINNFTEKTHGKRDRTTFTLDHYHQKANFPLFALSLFNLIPSCHICNCLIKGKRKIRDYKNPYSLKYDFHKVAKFEFTSIYDVRLKTTSKKCGNYIEDIFLEELYETHKSDIHDFVDMHNMLTKQLLSKYSFITKKDLSNIQKVMYGDFIFGEPNDLVPLSKLKIDLAVSLKIRK